MPITEPFYGAASCRAEHVDGTTTYYCTRAPGHEGEHRHPMCGDWPRNPLDPPLVGANGETPAPDLETLAIRTCAAALGALDGAAAGRVARYLAWRFPFVEVTR